MSLTDAEVSDLLAFLAALTGELPDPLWDEAPMVDEEELDLEMIEWLEAYLSRSALTLLMVTHDRFFLDRVCTHLLVFEGEGRVRWFEGNWQAYEEDRLRRLGPEAAQPHRIRYKPVVR